MTDALSPSEILSTEAIDRLIAAGLLRADKRDALIVKVASGNMTSEDWRFEINLAQATSEQE